MLFFFSQFKGNAGLDHQRIASRYFPTLLMSKSTICFTTS